jgi:hypothetical protein
VYRFRNAENQLLVARDVFVIAFFSEQSFPDALPGITKVFDQWLSVVPQDKLEWARVGPNSSSYKDYTAAAVKRSRAELDDTTAQKKSAAFFSLRGGEDMHNPSYGFTFLGASPGGKAADRTCLVEIRWPSEFPWEFGCDALVSWVRELGELLPYRSAYASPALTRGWEDLAHVREGAKHIVPLAFQHPGFDIPENETTTSFMGKLQCRGARWLTLLGPGLLEGLGGREALASNLDAGLDVLEAGPGVLVRAGECPEVGDVNRGDVTPLLRSVAAAIEKVTYFEDWRALGDLFDDDEDKVLRWERRHLD